MKEDSPTDDTFVEERSYPFLGISAR